MLTVSTDFNRMPCHGCSFLAEPDYPEPVVVAALDASNHLVTRYTGTVTLTDTIDSTVTPLTYTFQTGDHGYHIFMVTFNTTGAQTLTATDGSGLSGTATVNVHTQPTGLGGGGGIPDGAEGSPMHGEPLFVAAAGPSRHSH
jgi:hypothetical protein